MNAVIFIRNLFTVLSLGTILKAQQIGKDIDLKLINEILFLISSNLPSMKVEVSLPSLISCNSVISVDIASLNSSDSKIVNSSISSPSPTLVI